MLCHGRGPNPDPKDGRDRARPSREKGDRRTETDATERVPPRGKPMEGHGPSWPSPMEGHALSWPQARTTTPNTDATERVPPVATLFEGHA